MQRHRGLLRSVGHRCKIPLVKVLRVSRHLKRCLNISVVLILLIAIVIKTLLLFKTFQKVAYPTLSAKRDFRQGWE